PSLGLACYSVSKAAVISMTKNFAQELGPQGIRVNCVAPGLVDTRFAELLIKTPEFHRAAIDRAALHRHGEPDEIARTVLYLCSDMSAFMTGAVMVVDGGSRF
ncbi:MAG: SDR family oxidoreductase, partial [Candidatus Binatia bacterium]